MQFNILRHPNFGVISGLIVIFSFITAMCVANIDYLEGIYQKFVFFPISFGRGELIYHSSLNNIVSDGLMSLFFLLIGLELKFHLIRGELSNIHSLFLPIAAAVGGIIVPSIIYLYFNNNSVYSEGWAIAIATDTAFMLAIISFFGTLISPQLRAFIIGFSLIDDAIALLILAIFYSADHNVIAIAASGILISSLICLNYFQVKSVIYYLAVGVLLWITMVDAGVHGTLSGIVVALAIPLHVNEKPNQSLLNLEEFLKLVVYFIILPLFVFINSGINFDNFSFDTLKSSITLGIIFGLFIGKPLGIFLFSYIVVKLKCCTLPKNTCWQQFGAVAALGGIGFTLSLFIGDLVFETSSPNYSMRSGVIIGSILSAIFGIIYLTVLKLIQVSNQN